MAEKLPRRSAASLESIASSDSNPENLEKRNPTSDKADFITGVRRGLRKIGGFSPSRGKPADIQIGETSRSTDASSATTEPTSQFRSSRSTQHGGSLSNTNQLEKPLPKTPRSPPIVDLLRTPYSHPDTPKPFYNMSKIG